MCITRRRQSKHRVPAAAIRDRWLSWPAAPRQQLVLPVVPQAGRRKLLTVVVLVGNTECRAYQDVPHADPCVCLLGLNQGQVHQLVTKPGDLMDANPCLRQAALSENTASWASVKPNPRARHVPEFGLSAGRFGLFYLSPSADLCSHMSQMQTRHGCLS